MGYAERVIADGASYYWRLNEPSGTTAVDSVGGANGTISGGVTLGQPGALSDGTRAMTFDGTTGKVVTAANVTLPVVATVEVWIKLDSTVAHIPIFSIRSPSATGSTVYLGTYHDGGAVIRAVAAFSGVNTIYGSRVVRDGQWHHCVYVLGSSSLSFYVDGVVDTATGTFSHATVATGPVGIGFDIEGTIFGLGLIDEVAVYPRALTAPEIAAHYTLAKQSVSWPGVPWWVQIQGGDILDSFNVWEPVTPSDTVNLPRGVAGGIWVGAGGDVAAVMGNNVMPVVLAAVPTGAWLPLAAKRINSTGTTATNLVALYEV